MDNAIVTYLLTKVNKENQETLSVVYREEICDNMRYKANNTSRGDMCMAELRFDGKRLERAMDGKFSDAELAKEVGVTRQMIFHLRKGTRKTASAELVAKIAAALGVSTAYLLGQEEGAQEEVPKAIRDLLQIVSTLSEARREEVLRIAAALQKLEAEQAATPLPDEAMPLLIQIAEILKNNPANGDVLEMLRKILGGGSGRWLIDLGNNSPDDPGDDE